jgi:PAS domain S-box-containing protein
MNTEADINKPITDFASEIQFTDIFNLEEIQYLQDLFSDANGVASLISDLDGTPITKPSNFCRLCKDIIRKTEIGAARCCKSDSELCTNNIVGRIVKPCTSVGLLDARAKIVVSGKHIANWLIGQVRTDEIDSEQLMQFADEIGTNREDFIAAFNEVPIMSLTRFNKLSEMLFVFATELSKKAYTNLQLKIQIAEREEANKLLRESEEQFHRLYINMVEGAVLHELTYNEKGEPDDYLIIETNPAFELQLGITRDTVIGKTGREAYGVSEPPYFDIYSRVALTGEPIVFETYFPPLEKHFSISVYCPRKGSFATIFEDITKRKIAEIELRESEEQYHNLADSGLALIWTAGTDKLCNYFNEPWFKFTGRTLEQEIGNGWAEGVHPMDLDQCIETYVNAFDKRETFAMEYRLRHVSGEYRWLLDKGTPNYNINGEFIGYIGHCFDINDLKQAAAEIKIKNEELHQLVAEKDKFFSIIAHDLRSPFNSFLGLTQIMAEELPRLTMEEIQKIAVNMRSSATNLFRLLENLLQWSRIKQGSIAYTPEVVQLLPIVDESIEMVLESARNKGIEITYDIPIGLTVFADGNMLQTVIRNLVSNAVKFTPKEGKIIFSAKVTNESSILISIKDTGIGMSKAMIDNLFNIKEQTNRKGTEGEPSTGLGLLLCKEFIGKHGGTIWVDSEEEKGSTFYFVIPNDCNSI